MSNFSSLIIRKISAKTVLVENGITAQYDPNARGVNNMNIKPPVYIGCRTILYGPVSIIFCSSLT